MTTFDRASGILLHITSLPGNYAVGDLGAGARNFVDFLQAAGQRIWQLLPLGPTIQCDSPYSCYSAFAGNPLLISIEDLVASGWLTDDDLEAVPAYDQATDVANYAFAATAKTALIKRAFESFDSQAAGEQRDALEAFCGQQAWWLDDFALFASLMRHFGTDQWTTWPEELVSRNPEALTAWREQLSRSIAYEKFVQFLFANQWSELKAYANQREIQLFGDMPIFVAHGSADVWANQSLFALKPNGESKLVAGVPPDYFSKTGQLWGNPQYNWEALAKTEYHWWTQRFRMAFELYDLLRIDHFRAFEAYWEVPATAKTAVGGRWVKGPGSAPFEAAAQALGDLPIVAEDLGMITQEVHDLREQLQFPGMRVLQFGFDSEEDTFHRPESFSVDSAAYTGTHDNSTLVGWLNERRDREHDVLRTYLEEPSQTQMPHHWQLISMVLRSPARIAIVPLQDVLGLGDEARMNVPGQATGNWTWRYEPEQLTQELTDRLNVLTLAADRCASNRLLI